MAPGMVGHKAAEPRFLGCGLAVVCCRSFCHREQAVDLAANQTLISSVLERERRIC